MPTPAASPTTSSSSRSRRRHERVFSGCWTCRAKHVKCDETKPVCKRCERLDLHCQGYGVKLSWGMTADASTFASSKRYSARQLAARRTTRQADAASPDTTERRQIGQLHSRGNYRHTEHDDEPTTCHTSAPNLATQSSPHAPHRSSESFSMLWTAPISTANSQHGHHTSAPTQDSGGSFQPASNLDTIAALDTDANTHTDVSWLPSIQFGVPPSTPSNTLRTHSPLRLAAGERSVRHLDSLSDHASRCKILEHWDLYVCDGLGPIPGINNPVRTIFTPMALEGAREDAERSTGAVALFHLICSAAGFHLCKTEQLPRSKYKFESQALEHHNLGITHLRNQIQSEDETQYEAVLASLIMCLLNEAITVYDPFWRLHIQGAVDWVNHVGLEYWNRSESARTIYQMFMCMGILIQSQILPGDRSNHGWFLRYNPESQPGPYILDSIFGIPECILEVICTMNCVQTDARQGNGEARQDQSSPTYDLDTLELELFLMVPRRPNLSVTNQKYEQLLYHHGYAYYYAAILYMKRTLKGVPLKEVQNLVKQALQHVEALHNVDTGPSSPSLWPIAIIAFEAQDPLLQKRMQTSLDAFAKQSRLEVWVKFAESVRGLWARRRQSPGEGNLSWHAYSPVFYHNYVFI